MNVEIEHTILADFDAEWGLSLKRAVAKEEVNLCCVFGITYFLFIHIVALKL